MADELPHVVHEGTMTFGGLTIRVLHLSDGQRIIPAEDVERFMAALMCQTKEEMPRDVEPD